ncbi:MAG: HNH endonuclease [Ignavibacteria bacterium]|nr:HNH endonuclease [Ignavibacteria bacterium]
MFKTIRSEIKSNQHVFSLLNDLDKYSENYLALQDPYSIIWQGNRERFKRVREMKLFGVKQQLPLLMVAKEKFSDQEFDKTLKVISIISFRYNVIGSRQANRMEELYNSVSQKIFNAALTTAQAVFNEIKELYVSDQDFRNDFSTIELYSYGRSKKLARYVLFELENNLMQGGDRDFELDPATIEHILPENASAAWDNDFPQIIQPNFIYRLGNYTLLEDHLNRDCEVLPFDQKKPFYIRSQYEMSKDINSNEWNPAILNNRQSELARKATSIWRISYAD